MTMRPNVRKFVRAAHTIFAVGWLGVVAGSLALAIVGLNSRDTQLVRASYLAMDLITRFVILLLSLIPLLITGPILSLGTPWGLFRHYWIIVKLVINFLSTAILLIHLRPISYMARVAAERTISAADRHVQIQLVAAATGLAVFKPRGMTVYVCRKQYAERTLEQDIDSVS